MINTITFGGRDESVITAFHTLNGRQLSLDQLKSYICDTNIQGIYRMKKVDYQINVGEQTFALRNHEQALKMTCPCRGSCLGGYNFLATPLCTNVI